MSAPDARELDVTDKSIPEETTNEEVTVSERASDFPSPYFTNLDSVKPEYANYIHVLHDHQGTVEVILGHISPPIIRSDEEQSALLRHGFAARAVSRIVVTSSTLRDFMRVLQFQLDQMTESVQQPSSSLSSEDQSNG